MAALLLWLNLSMKGLALRPEKKIAYFPNIFKRR